jgi:hypothetical protein
MPLSPRAALTSSTTVSTRWGEVGLGGLLGGGLALGFDELAGRDALLDGGQAGLQALQLVRVDAAVLERPAATTATPVL